MRSLTIFQVAIICIAVISPALVPLVTGRNYTPAITWKAVIAVSILKSALSVFIVALFFTDFPRWLASLVGEALYLASTIGMLIGIIMLISTGFWGDGVSVWRRGSRSMDGCPDNTPPLLGTLSNGPRLVRQFSYFRFRCLIIPPISQNKS